MAKGKAVKMTNRNFEKFLKLSIKNFGDGYIDYDPVWDKPYEFTPKFKAKEPERMKEYFKIIENECKKRFIKKVLKRSGLCAVIALTAVFIIIMLNS